MNRQHRVWLALGSNLGDSNHILQQAWQELGHVDEIELIELSRPYVTEPVGMESDNNFLNAVGILETIFSPESFLVTTQQIEKSFGRNKKTGVDGYQDRLLDLDILYFSDYQLAASNLILPHPHISERLFVLAPLVQIDPHHCDPVTGQTAMEMHQNLLQDMKVEKIAFQEIRRENWS